MSILATFDPSYAFWSPLTNFQTSPPPLNVLFFHENNHVFGGDNKRASSFSQRYHNDTSTILVNLREPKFSLLAIIRLIFKSVFNRLFFHMQSFFSEAQIPSEFILILKKTWMICLN